MHAHAPFRKSRSMQPVFSGLETCCCPGKMVGLRNCSTWEPLLLKSSCIKSCANGCSLGITAHLSYANADTESVEGELKGTQEDQEFEHLDPMFTGKERGSGKKASERVK